VKSEGPSSLQQSVCISVAICVGVCVSIEDRPFSVGCADKLANQDASWMLSGRRPRDACSNTNSLLRLTERQVALGDFEMK